MFKALWMSGFFFLSIPVLALPTPVQVVQVVYQKLPDFPKGLQAKEGSHNLLRRLVTYHNFTKGRSPYSRFDWKLTVADYLGANEVINYQEYPGREEFPVNPLLDDQRTISKLSRSEREKLIQTLLQSYRENP